MNPRQLREVLYVDDDPDIRELVQMSLETISQIEVRTADTGEAALCAMRTHRPDIVLLDVMMPGLDGPATLQRMRQSDDLVSIPVLFMTAKSQPLDLERLCQLGAIGVIGKPFDPMRLADQLLAHWQGLGGGGD